MSEEKLKPMVYRRGETELLGKGKYKNFKWGIVSYGTHPCAYVCIEPGHELFKKEYNDFNLDVHGGVTYSEFGLHDIIDSDIWVIGWDYNHAGDYSVSFPYGRKYTTEEIYNDVIAAIDDIEAERW